MEEENCAHRLLQEIGPIVAPLQVRQFMDQDRLQLARSKLAQRPGWQHNRRLPEADGRRPLYSFGNGPAEIFPAVVCREEFLVFGFKLRQTPFRAASSDGQTLP